MFLRASSITGNNGARAGTPLLITHLQRQRLSPVSRTQAKCKATVKRALSACKVYVYQEEGRPFEHRQEAPFGS